MLDALAQAGARATFFVVAPLAARHPELLRRATERGHEVALHCYEHSRHDRMSAAEILGDATRGLEVLRGLGHEVRDWRTPWGVVTPDTEEVASGLGLRPVGWTADSEDWRGEDAETMLGRLGPGVTAGAVVLMHDGVGPGALRDGCGRTVDLIRPLVSLALSRGLAPATLSEMPAPLPLRNPGDVAGV